MPRPPQDNAARPAHNSNPVAKCSRRQSIGTQSAIDATKKNGQDLKRLHYDNIGTSAR